VGELAADMDRKLAQWARLVADPVDMRMGEEFAVHAATASRTHFEDEIGKPAAYRILQPVESLVMRDQRILVGEDLGHPGRPAALAEIGIEVPLHPADADGGQDPRDPLEGVPPRGRHAEVEDRPLIGRRGPAVDVVQPLGVLAPDGG
jgi:hypothetical protein